MRVSNVLKSASPLVASGVVALCIGAVTWLGIARLGGNETYPVV
jgi:hypothetical protein